jgi:hypothetical protein
LGDLHDDLSGKVARFRQLVDLSGALGSSGTMLFGGDITDAAWREARWSFIHGNFAATVLICQGLAEHLLGSFLHAALLIDDFPKRVSFADTLRRCQERNVISDRDATSLRRLMDLRNPLSHFRDLNDPAASPGEYWRLWSLQRSICGATQALQSALPSGSSRCRPLGSENSRRRRFVRTRAVCRDCG